MSASRWLLAGLLGVAGVARAAEKRCLYVSSYENGYSWNRDISQGVHDTLKGKCKLRQFDLDTKRNPAPEFAQKKAAEAMDVVKTWKPDVVIVSDDNAVKYFLQPHLKDSALPVVFCGLNWSGAEYGLPYRNATGMIEVNAISQFAADLIEDPAAWPAVGGSRPDKAACLSVDNETDRKLCGRFVKAFERKGVTVSEHYVLKAADWLARYKELQQSDVDFLILPTNAGINDWDEKTVLGELLGGTRKLSISVYDWMTPYAIWSYANDGREQGEYAASVALELMGVGGKKPKSPQDLPVVNNRKWNIFINEALRGAAKISLPPKLLRKARKTGM